MKPHILKRHNRYYYNRRVPEEVKSFDSRETIRLSLKTDSLNIALKRSRIVNQHMEAYWQSLINNNESHSTKKFNAVTKLLKSLGHSYLPNADLAQASLQELITRAKKIDENRHSPIHVEALAGGVDIPAISISQALEKFWSHSKDRILNKSENQIRKWQNPRKKAVRNFIKVVGNKDISDLTRQDITKFRNWWINEVEVRKSASTANKDLIHFKNIIETVVDAENLDIKTDILFRKITLKEYYSQKRKPLSKGDIVNKLLSEDSLSGLDNEAKLFLFVMAETGARISELTGLEPEDIHLNVPIPYIEIKSRPHRELKTPHSERTIPLIGYALWAMKQLPEGFNKYRNKTDYLSTFLNKYLRKKDLLPSKEHSVYSLRHSFQDRLLRVNTPDRVQAELMGHKFHRPKYGDGASLSHKKEWLEKICLMDQQLLKK